MYNKKIKFLSLLFALSTIISCGKLGEKDKTNALDTKAAVSEIGDRGAAEIVAYNNAMVDFLNRTGSKMDNLSGDIERLNQIVNNKSKPIVFIGAVFLGSAPDLENAGRGVNLLSPRENLPGEIKDSLANSLKEANNAFLASKTAYGEYKSYLDNEDFKDDDWKRGAELVETMEENLKAYYSHEKKSLELIEPLAKTAEEELLKNHPYKEAILAAKTDLAISGEILELLSAESINMEELNKKYDELEASAAKNSGISTDELKKHYKEKVYGFYYNALDNFLGEVRKSKRDNTISDIELRTISRKYESVIRSYNSFAR